MHVDSAGDETRLKREDRQVRFLQRATGFRPRAAV